MSRTRLGLCFVVVGVLVGSVALASSWNWQSADDQSRANTMLSIRTDLCEKYTSGEHDIYNRIPFDSLMNSAFDADNNTTPAAQSKYQHALDSSKAAQISMDRGACTTLENRLNAENRARLLRNGAGLFSAICFLTGVLMLLAPQRT
jgi:hypothetical protein